MEAIKALFLSGGFFSGYKKKLSGVTSEDE